MLDHKASFLSAQPAHQVITRLTSGKKQPISYKRLTSSLPELSVCGPQFNKGMLTTIQENSPPLLPILSQNYPLHALSAYRFKIHLYITDCRIIILHSTLGVQLVFLVRISTPKPCKYSLLHLQVPHELPIPPPFHFITLILTGEQRNS